MDIPWHPCSHRDYLRYDKYSWPFAIWISQLHNPLREPSSKDSLMVSFSLLWLAFHPWTGWWLLGGSLCATWQYVREHHREAAAEITDNAEKAKIRASSLLIWARDEAAAAERCELQVHHLATGITRDARSAHYIGLAGFYHEAAAQRSPEGKITYAIAAGDTSNIAIRVTQDALKATEAARAVRDSADPVSKLTIDAKSLAAIGDIEAAKAVVSELQAALESCEKSHGDAVLARESAQLMMAKFHYRVINEDQEEDPPTPQPEEESNEETAEPVD